MWCVRPQIDSLSMSDSSRPVVFGREVRMISASYKSLNRWTNPLPPSSSCEFTGFRSTRSYSGCLREVISHNQDRLYVIFLFLCRRFDSRSHAFSFISIIRCFEIASGTATHPCNNNNSCLVWTWNSLRFLSEYLAKFWSRSFIVSKVVKVERFPPVGNTWTILT